MPLPPNIDNKIRASFEKLIKEGEELLVRMSQAHLTEVKRWDIPPEKIPVLPAPYSEWQTKVKSLLNYIGRDNPTVQGALEQVIHTPNEFEPAAKILGTLKGLYEAYQSEMLGNLVEYVEAEVVSDYLTQAQQLLAEGHAGKHDYVPAAVLTGAVLEDALRRLCQRQAPPISVFDAQGKPKKMSVMIEDLKKSGLYNENKAKQLRSWAGTRNHAAHGEFTEFKRAEVEAMITGVENFLADYL
ncbi:MAG: DUF4145 domain-containing protein [Chloroflexi bacterium]|nr:DUF4145 domain-containing protein [Chloroflexota bacterium]